jgi:hypothetical protein
VPIITLLSFEKNGRNQREDCLSEASFRSARLFLKSEGSLPKADQCDGQPFLWFVSLGKQRNERSW